MKRCRFIILVVLFSGVALPLQAQTQSVSDNYIQIVADPSYGIMGLGTSSTYPPLPNAALMYDYPNPGYTSHIVAMVNGVAYDYSTATTTAPLTAVGSGLGAYLEITKSIVPGVLLTAHYEIANNPETGLYPDTALMKFTYTNTGATPVTLGLRLEIDTLVNGNDGANISVNNGASTVPVDTLYTQNAGTLPSQWWDYDIPPPAIPNLTGYGALYNNGYGPPATKPDAFEIGYWPNVQGTGQWSTGTLGASIADSAVVYWWTGTGDNSNGNIVLNPGQSISFTAYYGLNEIALLTTPTPTSTPTPTPPPCTGNTCTPTNTPTNTATFTLSPTPSSTSTLTPTYTPSFSPTFTSSSTPTFTATLTASLTPTASPTHTPTQTATASPTNTATPTATLTPCGWPGNTCTWTPTFTPTNTPYSADIFTVDKNILRTGDSVSIFVNYTNYPGQYDLRIYNSAGEHIKTLDSQQLSAPVSQWYSWDGKNKYGDPCASGVYILYLIEPYSAKLKRILMIH